MEKASKDRQHFLFPALLRTHRHCSQGVDGRGKKLSSKHFIYFTSSDFHITCILQKRKAEGQNIRCLTQGHLVASGTLGPLNSSPLYMEDLAASAGSSSGASVCISRLTLVKS